MKAGRRAHPVSSVPDEAADMAERKRRHSQNNHLLREIMERLREYGADEVVIICNKFRQRRNLPPLEQKFLDSVFSRR